MSAPDLRARLMVAFPGMALDADAERRLRSAPAAGISLFRYLNVTSPGQVRELTEAAQHAASAGGWPGPLLVAGDQETGQLMGLGDATTPFPGNMALAATGDPALAERVGAAIGTELLAMGVNIAYAPVCDLANPAAAAPLGIRTFGDDPETVATFAAAMIRGLRGAGVAASAKHFPGLGAAVADSHVGLSVLDHDRARLDAYELRPFRQAIGAGADLVMSAHVALPAVTGDPTTPATLSRAVMDDLLRHDLGFAGLTITDALDMSALAQHDGGASAAVSALQAGVDLLLAAPDPARLAAIDTALLAASGQRRISEREAAATEARIAALRRRLAVAATPPLDVVGSAPHQTLAREVAERSITLVRDVDGLLPLRLRTGDRLLAVMPQPRELTPADTSAVVAPGLARALRRRWPDVRELVTSHPPTDEDIAGAVAAAADAELIVVGTIIASADAAQVALVEALVGTGRPVVTVSLRTPWDADVLGRSGTHLAAYGLLPPTLDAVAAALFGEIPMRGRLPVRLGAA